MKTFLGVIGVASLLAGSAFAADLPVKAPPRAMPLAPAYSWTGCYIGGNAGYAWGTSNVSYSQTGAYLGVGGNAPADIAFAHALGSPSIDMNGFTGGGQIGCNYQVGSFVFGIEGDGEYVGLSGTANAAGNLPVAGPAVASSTSVSSHSLFTVRPRAGFAVDRAWFYATGGFAAGNVRYSETFTHLATNSVEAGSVSSTKSGWAVGGGVEYALTNNWTVKGEYLYVNLGSVGFNTANNLFPTFTSANSASFKENIVRLGLNYKF